MSEIARELDLDVDEVLEAMDAAASFRPASLDAARPWRADGNVMELATVDAGFDRVERRLTHRAVVDELVERLDEPERRVVELYHRRGLTQQQVADRTGSSQVWVSRTLRRAVDRLRAIADPVP